MTLEMTSRQKKLCGDPVAEALRAILGIQIA